MRQIVRTTMMVLLTMCFMAHPAQAQDAKKAIREHYAAVKEQLKMYDELNKTGDVYPVPQMFSVVVKQNLPATGYHEETIQMMYREDKKSDEQIYADLYLEFATKKYNFAVRQFYEEYLYDKQGRIQFIYALESDFGDVFQREYRFYFNQGKLIDVNIKSRANDSEPFKDIYSGKTVPDAYRSYYQDRTSSAKSIMTIFKTIDSSREL